MIHDNWDHSQEVRCRIEKVRATFNQMVKKDLEVMNTTKRRKLEYVKQIMRNESKHLLLMSVSKGNRKKKNMIASFQFVIISRMIANIRNKYHFTKKKTKLSLLTRWSSWC